VIEGLILKDIYWKGPDYVTYDQVKRVIRHRDGKSVPWALTFECKSDFWRFKNCNGAEARGAHLKNNPHFLRHQSLMCLIADGEVVAFPSIVRDEKLLAEERPILVLRFDNGRQGITNALMRLPKAAHVKLIQIDTAVFAYEPILTSLQSKFWIPMTSEILFFKDGMTLDPPIHQPKAIVAAIKAAPTQNLQHLLDNSKPVHLDQAQADALINALSQRVALIQGPPGMCTVHCFVML
jgi:hypothetical protein